MKSQKVTAYGEPLQAVEEATPDPQGTETIVRITHCGVCHSDLHIHDGAFDLGGGKKLDISGQRTLPFTLGHEIMGEVVAVGPEATGISVGDRRAVYPWIGCGKCKTCRAGRENDCATGKPLGIGRDGGFSDHAVVPHPRYLLDPQGVPDNLAGSFMCSGLTAYSALQKAGALSTQDHLLILGFGGVGYMGLLIAKALTDAPIWVADIDAAKRDEAVKAGADFVIDPEDKEAYKRLMAETDGGVDAVIDFVASEASNRFALKSVRRGGRIVVVGLFGGELRMGIAMLPLRGLSLIGSMTGSLQEAEAVLKLAASGKVPALPVEERPLAEANRSLQDLRGGRVIGRIVLTP